MLFQEDPLTPWRDDSEHKDQFRSPKFVTVDSEEKQGPEREW